MIDKIPHVFISYSWTSEEYKLQVRELAERLIHDGIKVDLDIWDLKEGDDKYDYMEKCVRSPNIDKVLILADKGYMEKANSRNGGVGNETIVISPEVYENSRQQKYIPIIMERDEKGKEYLPAYLKGRLYIDLSGRNYEDGYEKLVRVIYEKPEYLKPELGKRPKWLDEDSSSELYILEKRYIERHCTSSTTKDNTIAFFDEYVEKIRGFHKEQYRDGQEYLDDLSALKKYRNVFLDYLDKISQRNDFGLFMADMFERIFNSICDLKAFGKTQSSYNISEFDIFGVHIWELFLCTVTYMLHNELYSDINQLLVHTYYLKTYPNNEEIEPNSYARFRYYSSMLEERIKPVLGGELSRKYTLTGHLLMTEREYRPIYTRESLSMADLFLYQVYKGLELDNITIWGHSWFPTCYIYSSEKTSLWKRLESKRFCDKIMKVFGVEGLDGLKKCIAKCESDNSVRYGSCFTIPAPAILDIIDVDRIGVLP